jgi:hypothetical protein
VVFTRAAWDRNPPCLWGDPWAQLPASFMREISTDPLDLLPCV